METQSKTIILELSFIGDREFGTKEFGYIPRVKPEKDLDEDNQVILENKKYVKHVKNISNVLHAKIDKNDRLHVTLKM